MKKLLHYVKCSSNIEVLTGIHVGGPTDEIKIGGLDNPVIKNPVTNLPYIPGSSLKGRFRMALELKYNDVTKENRGYGPSEDMDNQSNVVKLFGSGSPQKTTEPTRFIFRDANLTADSLDYAEGEEKIEVKIDREKGAAFSGGIRKQERVPAGAKFNFEVNIRIFDGDDEKLFKTRLEEAAKIVELEYLGGSGTRGYGQVKFAPFSYEKIEI